MDEQEVTPPGDAPVPSDIPVPTEPTGAATPATPEPTPELPTTSKEEEKGGEVEVDITDLVNSTKDTKDKIEGTNELLNTLVSKFDELESKIASFDEIIGRLNQIEQDFEKRLPTPVEKLEMRSMDSFPYSVKLSDYWKEETENIEGEDTTKQGEEYVLTPEDIKKDYNPSTIKTSFGVESSEDQDFNI